MQTRKGQAREYTAVENHKSHWAESSRLEGKGALGGQGREAGEFSSDQIAMALMDFVLSLKS